MSWFKLPKIGSSHVPPRPFPTPKMPIVQERTLHLKAVIKALEMADKAWSERELDAWLLSADALLNTCRKQPEDTSK